MIEIPSCILSQYLWYNWNIQVDKTSIHFSRFSEKNINYVSQLFNNIDSIKKWHKFKGEYNLHQNSYFQWVQLTALFQKNGNLSLKKNNEVAANLITHDHHLIKGSRLITLDKITSTEICSILTLKIQNKPSNIYFENSFNYYDIDWTAIYMLPRLVAHNTYMRSFQYKVLNDILFLNKKLHIFGIKPSPLCSFCNLYDETPFHIFYECDRVKFLWSELVQCFQNTLILPTLTPQTAILGILDSVSNNSFFENNKELINYQILIFKLYVYKSREKKFININSLIAEIRKVKRIVEEIALNNSMETTAFRKE